jgi:CO/xanthine dehydrogenase FAD-binding subunit
VIPNVVRVDSIEDLLDGLRTPGAAVVCGGTDLVVKMRGGLASPRTLLDISGLEALRTVREERGSLAIGAAVPVSELLSSSLVEKRAPLLLPVLGKLGSVQIRNRATLGGNLANASPAADSAVPLLLYDAEVILRSVRGTRRLPVEAFLRGPGKTDLAPGEFLQSIVIAPPSDAFTPFFHKVGRRKALTIAIASLGALVRVQSGVIEAIRLAAGSVAPTPIRLRTVEAALTGQQLDEALVAQARALAAAAVSPIDDIRGSAAYRRAVVGDLLAAFLDELQG